MDAEAYFKNIENRLSALEKKVDWILDYLNGVEWKKDIKE